MRPAATLAPLRIPGGAVELARAVSEAFPGSSSPLHGEDHWLHVAYAGSLLLQAGNAADPIVVFLFALLHDSHRLNEGRDHGHGPRAAEFARLLADRSYIRLEPDELDCLAYALAGHDAGKTSDDLTVGTCWDADRLNLARLSITPDPALLSTAAGRQLAPRAGEIVGTRCHWSSVIHDFEVISRDRPLEAGARRDHEA